MRRKATKAASEKAQSKWEELARSYELLAKARGAGDRSTFHLLARLATNALLQDRYDQVEAISKFTGPLWKLTRMPVGENRRKTFDRLERLALADQELRTLIAERRTSGDPAAQELWRRIHGDFGAYDPSASRELIAREGQKALDAKNYILVELLANLYMTSTSKVLFAVPCTVAPDVAGHVRGSDRINTRNRKPRAQHGGTVRAEHLHQSFVAFEKANPTLSFAECKHEFARQYHYEFRALSERIRRVEKKLGIVRKGHAK